MNRDLAAWVETQVDLRTNTLPSTTIIPRRDDDLERAVALLEQIAGTSLVASVQLRPGAVIGEGGMGIVREAEQIALGRTVAIKTLKDGKSTPEAARDLLREAWVTGSLERWIRIRRSGSSRRRRCGSRCSDTSSIAVPISCSLVRAFGSTSSL